MNPAITIALVVAALIIGFGVGYFIRKSLAEAKISSAEQAAVQIVENAKKEAEALKKETVLEAKDEIHRIRAEAEKDTRERRNEIQRQERRLLQKKSRWIKNWNHSNVKKSKWLTKRNELMRLSSRSK